MDRLIVIVGEVARDATTVTMRLALRVPVPAGQEALYANPAATSAAPATTPEELAELQAGQAVEKTVDIKGLLSATVQQGRSAAEGAWTTFENQINAANPHLQPGVWWDGGKWHLAGL